jgi:hypothetical protein
LAAWANAKPPAATIRLTRRRTISLEKPAAAHPALGQEDLDRHVPACKVSGFIQTVAEPYWGQFTIPAPRLMRC